MILQKLEYWLSARPQPRPARSEWEDHPDFQSAKYMEYFGMPA
jgi:hypothetical protein